MQIYKIINLINNKIYIGKEVRVRENYFGSGKIIQLAIKKYGKENFTKSVLEICNNKVELSLREIYWIAFFDSTNKKIGYNINKGGEGGNILGRKLSDETKEKIRQANLGRKDDDNRKKKISNSLKGRTVNTETKEKISASIKSSKKYKDSRLKITGIKHTIEHKQKISESCKGDKNGFYNKNHSDKSKEKMKISKLIIVPDDIIIKIVELRGKKNTYKQISSIVNYSVSVIIRILKERLN